METKLAIFDFDGTLARTAPVITATMMATIKLLGLPPRSEADCRATIGLRLEEAAAMLYPGIDVDGQLFADTYRREWHKYNTPGAVELFDGALACLHSLHDAGIEIAIGSSRNHESLDGFVSSMGLEKLVTCVVGGDDVTHGKPAPEMIDLVLKRTACSAQQAMMIGDSEYDILAANAAGTASMACTWGYGSQESMRRAHPTYVVNSFDEITRILKGDYK